MGIIRKQTIQGSIFAYLGAFLGFITRGYILPHSLSEEQVGLIGVLLSVAVLFAQFSNLGFNNVGIRLFPVFRNPANKHNGYLFLASIVTLVGFLIGCGVFVLFEQTIVAQYSAKSKLFVEYLYYLFPITFFMAFFSVFDGYIRALYNSTAGTFLREFAQRLFILIAVGIFLMATLSFKQFMIGYVLATGLPTFILMWLVYREGALDFRPNFSIITKDFSKQMTLISLFGVLSGISVFVISTIDTLMINHFLGLRETGIYTVAFYFGTIIVIPARSLYRITGTIIADAWKENDVEKIKNIYKQSCINQMLIGGLIFIGIWANIDNVFKILPASYESGKYVILFISLANFIEMLTGVNGVVLTTSKYYKYDTYFMILLMGLAIITNFLLIPLYGITGSAIASVISLFAFNFARFLILKLKYGMQPYSLATIKIFGILLITYFSSLLIPAFGHFIIDILIRSISITLAFTALVYLFRVSESLNAKADVIISKMLQV